jgi:hypothetical protein
MPEVAQVFARGDGVVENLDSVVRRSAARVRVVGNDARKSTTRDNLIYRYQNLFYWRPFKKRPEDIAAIAPYLQTYATSMSWN